MANPASIYYAVTTGLRGCYMPDQHHGALEFTSSTELGDYIFDVLDEMSFPAACADQVDVTEIYRDPVGFGIFHGGYALEFHALSEAEARAMMEDDR